MRAAEIASELGVQVTVFEAKRSVGRKFLVAGKSGLNLTNAAPMDTFANRFGGAAPRGWWDWRLSGFTNDDLRAWCESFGIGTHASSGKKVFPEGMKAAPLLRRWVSRLRARGVRFEVSYAWCGFGERPDDCSPAALKFSNGREVQADAVVFALGGGSWPATGSDGAWQNAFSGAGIDVLPLVSANCGWELDWPEGLPGKIEGQPLKNLLVRAAVEDSEPIPGELVVTRYGLEGGPIYRLGQELRAMTEPTLEIDFKPTFSAGRLVRKLDGVTRDHLAEAAKRWRLCDATVALLQSALAKDVAFNGADRTPLRELAELVKAFRIPLTRPRPISEAISSAGGVSWQAVDPETLMSRAMPGIFVCGEMLDWEAPTGGYLIHGSMLTGEIAARAAVNHLRRSP